VIDTGPGFGVVTAAAIGAAAVTSSALLTVPPLGASPLTVWVGELVSTVQVLVAGDGSRLPAWSTARACSVCACVARPS